MRTRLSWVVFAFASIAATTGLPAASQTAVEGQATTDFRRTSAILGDNVLCLQLFAKFLGTLKTISDADGPLLDRTAVFYGSGMGNSNVHATDPLPMVIAGGALGRGDRHVVLPKKTEIGNLWLSLANRFDSPITTFGESTGTVDVF